MRGVVVLLVAVLSWGTLRHAVDLLTGGWDAYAYAPGWLAAYWASLTVLDPLAAALLGLRRRSGPGLTAGVLVSDAAANAYAVHGLGLGGPSAAAGQAVVTLLAVLALAALPALLRRTVPAPPAG